MTRFVTPWETLGLMIGHDTDEDGATGCTVIRGAQGPFRCAASLLGRASATRELGTCAPEHLVDRTDAIFLTGGSAYGLDAAAGVMRWMEERGRGYPVGTGVVPIVPAAALFDLSPLGRFDARPTADMAYRACSHASMRIVPEGSVGAGAGATVGKLTGGERAMKGGVGVGSAEGPAGLVAALVVVNAFGDVRDGAGRILAGARHDGGGFVDSEATLRQGDRSAGFAGPVGAPLREHTTLACVAVSAALTKSELSQLASAATAALHRRITPCGTVFDGDVLFAIGPLDGPAAPLSTAQLSTVSLPALEMLAVAALEEAIERAVRLARGRDGVPGLADFSPVPRAGA